MAAFTKEQWLTIITFVIVNFCNAMCVSMQVDFNLQAPIKHCPQAPFYPREAVSKGLKVWHFGLVFGAFEITVFLVSPIIGASIKKIGVKVGKKLFIYTNHTFEAYFTGNLMHNCKLGAKCQNI